MKAEFQRIVATVVVAMGLLQGCGGESGQDLLSTAKANLEKNDVAAAIVNLKAALQKNPEQPEIRFMLGSSLLRQGDRAAAEVELRKVAELPALADRAVPLLAQAMLDLGQGSKVIEEFGARQFGATDAQARLQTTLAAAYAAAGKVELSERALAAALAADANHAPALLFGARRRASGGDVKGALADVEGVLMRNPGNSDAWILKGDLQQYGMQALADAEVSYRRALQADPGSLQARFALITVLTRQTKLADAGTEIAELKKRAPNNPQTRLHEAQHAFQKGDYKAAREMVQQLLRLAPKSPAVLQLAGAIEFRNGSWSQAESYLSRALLAEPDLPLARRQLILTYLRSGQSKKALATLDVAFAKGEDDPALLPIAGEVYLLNGDTASAEKYFVKALKVDPSDASRRAALAMLRVSSGRVAEGVSELNDIATTDKSSMADLALVSVHFRQQEYDKALQAVQRLEVKRPNDPLGANLRGRILLVKKDVAGARKSFERAIEIDAGFYPAVAALARLDLAENKPDEAKQRLEALLNKNPKNVQVLLALVQVAEARKAGKEELVGLLTRAVDVDPSDPLPRHVLVDVLLRHYDNKQALVVAQNGVSAAPDSLENLYLLGRVQQVSGDLNQAISTYSKLAALKPSAGSPYLRLAETQVANQDTEAARLSLRRALTVTPDYLEGQRALIALDLGARRFAEAKKTALQVQSQRPSAPDGFVLEGDVANVQKDWSAAASAYRAALQRGAAPFIATKLHAVLVAAGKASEAGAFAASWLKSQPKDTVLLLFLGELALKMKDHAAAEAHYLAALERNPDLAIALNNLAWVTSQLGKPGALAYAERANKLAPNQPVVMDTLAGLLADDKAFARAIELQSKALALQPTNSGLRFGLAKIYVKAGDSSRAKAELETLSKLGASFGAQAEVAALLKSL